jgi:hypothetical protein
MLSYASYIAGQKYCIATSSPIMFSLDKIAETRITEAMQRGDFDNLPGAGQPLKIDDNQQEIPRQIVGYKQVRFGSGGTEFV